MRHSRKENTSDVSAEKGKLGPVMYDLHGQTKKLDISLGDNRKSCKAFRWEGGMIWK